MNDPRWDEGCRCLQNYTNGDHHWPDGSDTCSRCGVAWDDRHYDVDGICVICGAGDGEP